MSYTCCHPAGSGRLAYCSDSKGCMWRGLPCKPVLQGCTPELSTTMHFRMHECPNIKGGGGSTVEQNLC